jgi:hypothetical protein
MKRDDSAVQAVWVSGQYPKRFKALIQREAFFLAAA